jgi:aconitate hydratase 2/2-methylisocitrate dehydratase
LLVFDFFHDVKELADKGDANAKSVLQSWADGEWFTSRPEVPTSQKLTVFKVTGETNTDDLSPAPDAWSRPDIPLHALAMLKNPRAGIEADVAGERGPIKQLEALAAKGNLIAYVGDVVGTGSSRKSATNSVLWFTGEDIPFVPNKRFGGFCLGSKIAPIFFNTMEDAGALPIELDVEQMDMGDEIELQIDTATAKVTALKNGTVIAESQLKTPGDPRRSACRWPHPADHRPRPHHPGARSAWPAGFDPVPCAAQPGRPGQGLHAGSEDGRPGLRPAGRQGRSAGHLLRTKMTTVGSQDTTGPMTRDELKDLACLGFSADMVMQSFCHTAAYPKLVDVQDAPRTADFHQHPRRRLAASGRRHHPLLAEPPAAARYRRHRRRLAHPLPDRHFLPGRLRPGRLCRRHRRDAAGHAGIGAGALQGQAAGPGVTLRDLVNAIPYYAIKAGLLTVEKKGKKNIFSGRILEIEGLPDLKVEQAFELSDASAERSAAGCTIQLEQGADHRVHELEHHADEVDDRQRLRRQAHPGRRIKAMEAWIANGNCSRPTPMPSTPR